MPDPKFVRGIDVSHWKPIKDWSAVWESGIRFIGMKATEGSTYVDPSLRLHRDAFRKNPFLLGIYYHFGREGSAAKQAERLMDAVGPLRDNERLCLDLEVSITSDPAATVHWLDEFFNVLMHGACSNRRPLIYTRKRIWLIIADPDWALAHDVDLWTIRYGSDDVATTIPKPWKDIGWKIWQYSDGETPLIVTPGVGKCDVNVFNGTEADLQKYAHIPTPTPPTGVPVVA